MTRCAEDSHGDRCQRQAGETCDGCSREFCWEHLLNVDVPIGAAMGEERVMCRECVAQDFLRLEQEHAELQQDVQMVRGRVAELEDQVG